MKNLILIGRGSRAKSSLIDALLTPQYGFRTRKYPPEENGWSPIYLHGFSQPQVCSQEHLVGRCKNHHSDRIAGAFDRIGAPLLENIPAGAIVVLDELGFLEQEDLLFQQAVFRLLDGDYRLLVSMKDKDNPFLHAVKAHPRSQCVLFQAEQAEALRRELPVRFPWLEISQK